MRRIPVLLPLGLTVLWLVLTETLTWAQCRARPGGRASAWC